MRWKIECYHRATKQSLGLGNYHGRELRGLIARACLVALAHLLLVFAQACLPSLKGEPIGSIIDSFTCTVCRMNTRPDQVTVLINGDFPHRKALRQLRLARAG